MLIKVITIDLVTGKTHSETNCNILRPNGKKWLDKHMIWAFSNNHGVQMLNLADKEPETNV
jgi:hypothetical protein